MKEYICGLDLGQVNDFTALALLEKIEVALPEFDGDSLRPKTRTEYHCRRLERLKLGTSYPVIVEHVKALLEHPQLRIHHRILVLDNTGVGRPVTDLFYRAHLSCAVVPVTIHGGHEFTHEGRDYRVPKRDLIASTQVLLESDRLKIATRLPEAATLVKELLDYRVKISPLAHDSYNAREGAHDDLLLALSLACWYGEHGGLPAQFVEVEGLW